MIPADDQAALAEARSAGAIEISDYGSFKLLAMDDAALEGAENRQSIQSIAPSSDRPITQSAFTVRDDFNVLLLRSGAIDTTVQDAPGSFIGMGRAANNETARLRERAEIKRL